MTATKSATGHSKNPASSGQKKFPNQILIQLAINVLTHRRLLFSSGIVLMAIGFVLTPVVVGLPLLLVGWLITTKAYWQRWLNFIPASAKQSLYQQIGRAYQPYTPALTSLSGQIFQILKTSIVIFIFLCFGFILFTKKLGIW